MLALRLPKDLEARLDALARATGRTKSYYAREAIGLLLEELEGAYLGGRRRTVQHKKVAGGRVEVVTVPNLDALVAAKKRASRAADQEALRSGRLTRQQLGRKNSSTLGVAFTVDMKRAARIRF
ncbi:MAG TPA: ribbon-helix-helix protein, CopG family [Anaeromyxobacteraceae bacterium]|nr:ribbon-helix-helix protein, CopG family [Anaeromyxobacteraceae bacterium]